MVPFPMTLCDSSNVAKYWVTRSVARLGSDSWACLITTLDCSVRCLLLWHRNQTDVFTCVWRQDSERCPAGCGCGWVATSLPWMYPGPRRSITLRRQFFACPLVKASCVRAFDELTHCEWELRDGVIYCAGFHCFIGSELLSSDT